MGKDIRFYGGHKTVHGSRHLDIVMEDNKVTEVWFRCQQLPFEVSSPKGHKAYGITKDLPAIFGIELIDEPVDESTTTPPDISYKSIRRWGWYSCTDCAGSGEVVRAWVEGGWKTFEYSPCTVCDGLGAVYRRPRPF